jgi:hypothetical protein
MLFNHLQIHPPAAEFPSAAFVLACLRYLFDWWASQYVAMPTSLLLELRPSFTNHQPKRQYIRTTMPHTMSLFLIVIIQSIVWVNALWLNAECQTTVNHLNQPLPLCFHQLSIPRQTAALPPLEVDPLNLKHYKYNTKTSRSLTDGLERFELRRNKQFVQCGGQQSYSLHVVSQVSGLRS